MKKSSNPELRIDEENQKLWRIRFDKPAFVASEAMKLLSEAEKSVYQKGSTKYMSISPLFFAKTFPR